MKGMCYVVCYFIALVDISKLSWLSKSISLDVFNEGNVYIIFKCFFCFVYVCNVCLVFNVC
jgi:hypothetical protein